MRQRPPTRPGSARIATHAFTDARPLVPSLPNLRDMGGHLTRGGGRVRSGLLYRSTELSRLAGPDAAIFASLGIRSVYDLRTREEREMQPDRLPAGTEHIVVDVLSGSTDASPAALMELFRDPRAASRALADGGAARMFERKYREFVSLDSARSGFGRLFRDLASEAHRPALVHCTTGKDRTGWAAAVLQMLLDVPDEAIVADFLRSNDLLEPTFRPLLDRFAARGGDPAVLLPLVGVRRSYLESALDEMRRSFGSLEGYVADGLGIDPATRGALRAALIERD